MNSPIRYDSFLVMPDETNRSITITPMNGENLEEETTFCITLSYRKALVLAEIIQDQIQQWKK